MATIHITRNVSSNHWIIVSVEAKETLASVTLCKAFSRATEAQISRPAYKTAAITAPHFASTERNVHRPTVITLSPKIGRASCRERVQNSGVAGSIKEKKEELTGGA